MTAIEIKNITKRYARITAVQNVSLRIPKNAFYAIVGPNGAGKSTLFGMVVGLLRQNAGTILINNQKTSNVKNIVGVLPQELGFYEHKSPQYHLEYWSRLQGMKKKDARKEAQTLLKNVGLEKRKNAAVRTLSNGMRKLLSIACAFVGDPDIIILDEPLVGLDPQIKFKIKSFLLSYKGKKTIIVCSHQLQEMEELCDHVAILQQGKILKQDKLAVILKKQHFISVKTDNPEDLAKKWIKKAGIKNISVSTNSLFIELSQKSLKDKRKIMATFLKEPSVSSVTEGKTLEKAFLDVIN